MYWKYHHKIHQKLKWIFFPKQIEQAVQNRNYIDARWYISKIHGTKINGELFQFGVTKGELVPMSSHP